MSPHLMGSHLKKTRAGTISSNYFFRKIIVGTIFELSQMFQVSQKIKNIDKIVLNMLLC